MNDLSPESRWLLDRASHKGAAVRLLLPETVDQVAQWNVASPRWNDDEALAALSELGEGGYIGFYVWMSDGRTRTCARQPCLDRCHIATEFRAGRILAYQLTPMGADTWENVAKPNWSRRYAWVINAESQQSDLDERERQWECIVTACDEESVRRALLVTAVGQNLFLVPGSERYCSIDGWSPTYWKWMRNGCCVRAVAGRGREGIAIDDQLPLAASRDHYESMKYFYNWYTPADDSTWRRIA